MAIRKRLQTGVTSEQREHVRKLDNAGEPVQATRYLMDELNLGLAKAYDLLKRIRYES